MHVTTSLRRLLDRLPRPETLVRRDRALLLGISGIDGSGKSTIAPRAAAALRERGVNAVVLGLDDWQHPRHVRFGGTEPGVHFYGHAFRWEELFGSLVLPLVRDRRVRLAARALDVVTDRFHERTWHFEDVDVVILEGIFLFRREMKSLYDVRWWIECPFDVALARALRRNQEGLPVERLRADYDRIYFPAQRHHAAVDAPAAGATGILLNDRDDPFAGVGQLSGAVFGAAGNHPAAISVLARRTH